jgi:hypothetical protein
VDDFSEFRQEWETVISRVIARAWVDPAFKDALIDNPTPILHDEGLVFPERYEVEFFEDQAARPGDWHSTGRGMKAVHRFPIPPAPPEVAVADSALGMDASGLACCCPCASCTGAVSHETWINDLGPTD